MAASKLGVFNAALRWLGDRQLASLAENREPRRLLDNEWTNAQDYCIRQGYWRHAVRFVKMTSDPELVVGFGYRKAFPKPADWIKTYQLSSDDRFYTLFTLFEDMNNVIYADVEPLYLKYISSDPNFGLNLALWGPDFTEYVAVYLAHLIAPRCTQSNPDIEQIESRLKKQKAVALANDAMDGPTRRSPYGSWVTSRAPRGSVTPIATGLVGQGGESD